MVLCHGLLRAMGLHASGRRNQLGVMHGPMNHESLNGTHPGMLAGLGCNSDVQLPYRFPITQATHFCSDPTCLQFYDEVIIHATQVAQDAQAGYACDYATKRQPMAFSEVKECCKGIQHLATPTSGEDVNRIGKRHATRLMTMAYGRGVVRGQVENANLHAYSDGNHVTAAESIHTSPTVGFLLVENMYNWYNE